MALELLQGQVQLLHGAIHLAAERLERAHERACSPVNVEPPDRYGEYENAERNPEGEWHSGDASNAFSESPPEAHRRSSAANGLYWPPRRGVEQSGSSPGS